MNILRYSFVSFAQLLYPFKFLLGTRTCCFILSPFQYFKELICLVLPPRFWGESGCKDKHFIPSYPNIFASFFKLFFQNYRFYQVRIMSDMFYKPILIFPESKAGANLRVFYELPNHHESFFESLWFFAFACLRKNFFGQS